ncbi:hypothetical protein HYS28_02335 [Candidatus Uhrbacteria bacterium]|nr:hypothetical protein [Candidatus Uhrbacteria bacterium]
MNFHTHPNAIEGAAARSFGRRASPLASQQAASQPSGSKLVFRGGKFVDADAAPPMPVPRRTTSKPVAAKPAPKISPPPTVIVPESAPVVVAKVEPEPVIDVAAELARIEADRATAERRKREEQRRREEAHAAAEQARRDEAEREARRAAEALQVRLREEERRAAQAKAEKEAQRKRDEDRRKERALAQSRAREAEQRSRDLNGCVKNARVGVPAAKAGDERPIGERIAALTDAAIAQAYANERELKWRFSDRAKLVNAAKNPAGAKHVVAFVEACERIMRQAIS